MRRRTTASLVGGLLAAAALAGCGQGGNEVVVTRVPGEQPIASPTEADPAPVVTGTIATGLAAPSGLSFLPDGSAVVSERDSLEVLLIRGQKHQVTTVGSLVDAAPRKGSTRLLDVAASPDFATDRLLYFYLSTAKDARIVRATLKAGRLGKVEQLLAGIPSGDNQHGGRLLFGADGALFVSTSDAGKNSLSLDLRSLGGKILRLAPDGSPATGNPFSSAIWSYGHRDVQGLAMVDDQLWASEHGKTDLDELNRAEAGESYGWPALEGTGGTSRGYVDPQVTWDVVDAPSGLAFLDGHLWLGSAVDETLWRVDVDAQGLEATNPVEFSLGSAGPLTTVVAAPDDTLWVIGDNGDSPTDGDPGPGPVGQILQVTP